MRVALPVVLVVLVVLAAQPAQARPRCRASGRVVLKIESRVDVAARAAMTVPYVPGSWTHNSDLAKQGGFPPLVATTYTLHASGAWTLAETTEAGKATPGGRGCVDKTTVKRIRDTIASAPWTIVAPLACATFVPESIVFSSAGTPFYTRLSCAPGPVDLAEDDLDDASQRAFARIGFLLEEHPRFDPALE